MKQWKLESLGQSGKSNSKIHADENNTVVNTSGKVWCRLLMIDLWVFQRGFLQIKDNAKDLWKLKEEEIRLFIKFVVNSHYAKTLKNAKQYGFIFLSQYISRAYTKCFVYAQWSRQLTENYIQIGHDIWSSDIRICNRLSKSLQMKDLLLYLKGFN